MREAERGRVLERLGEARGEGEGEMCRAGE